MIAQVVIAKRAGLPLIEHTCRKDGSPNPSNKFMAFVLRVPQIRQLHKIFRRALDFGWTFGTPWTEFSRVQ